HAGKLESGVAGDGERSAIRSARSRLCLFVSPLCPHLNAGLASEQQQSLLGLLFNLLADVAAAVSQLPLLCFDKPSSPGNHSATVADIDVPHTADADTDGPARRA